jgi:SAM-dependent methyltransferase
MMAAMSHGVVQRHERSGVRQVRRWVSRRTHFRHCGVRRWPPKYFSEYKIIDISRECGPGLRAASAPTRVLDFGSGIGNSLPYVRKHLQQASLTCLDLSQRSLEVAEKRFADMAEYRRFDGANIPFPGPAQPYQSGLFWTSCPSSAARTNSTFIGPVRWAGKLGCSTYRCSSNMTPMPVATKMRIHRNRRARREKMSEFRMTLQLYRQFLLAYRGHHIRLQQGVLIFRIPKRIFFASSLVVARLSHQKHRLCSR